MEQHIIIYSIYNMEVNIIGNGPSLNTINKNNIFKSKNINISYNRAFLIYEKYDFYPKYYFCIDKAVLLNSFENIVNLLDKPIDYFVLLRCKETELFEGHEKIILVEKNEDNEKYFGDVAVFSINFLYTVKKYNKFNIYGCDCSYEENYDKLNVDVEYNNNDIARRIILKPRKNTKDPNHFFDYYFGHGSEYSVPRENNHLRCWNNLYKNMKDIKIIFKTNSKAIKLFE